MAALPEPVKSLRAALEAISGRVARLERAASNKFSGTGLSVPADGVTQVDGSLVVQGGEAKSGDYVPATKGWHLGSDGTAEFKDITLYDLPNSMLANPVIPGSVWATASNFTVSPTWASIILRNVTVPDGCTACSIHAQGRITAFYNNAGTGTGVDYIYAHLYVSANSSGFYPLAVTDNGGSGTSQVFRDAVLTGLTPGSTFALDLQASTDFATWSSPASPGNQATLGATIQWYR